jgi:two-component system, LuxR family, response regulator FixJ
MGMSAGDRTVIVVDDDGPALDSLIMLLKSDGLAAKGFASAEAFLAAFDPQARGCVITDLRMPGMDGIDLIRALKAAGSALPVIVITGHADVSRAVDAMKAGASDFLEKPYESEVLLRAVRGCLEENGAAVDAGAARNRVLQRMETLTARERQVLDLILEGASNKVIALRLTISPRTVEIYRANVMSKMRADSLSELVRLTLAAESPERLQARGR